MDHIKHYFEERKYKFIDISSVIKDENKIMEYIKLNRKNTVLFMKNDQKLLNKIFSGEAGECALIINGRLTTIQLSKPIKTIERQIESIMHDKIECNVCYQDKGNNIVKCGDCLYVMCHECVCKLCEADKNAKCPKCRTAKLCDPRIKCNKCDKGWLGNPIICNGCNRTLCWSCVWKDGTISLLTFKDTEGIELQCSKCGERNLIIEEPKGEIQKKLSFTKKK